jgi:Rrf2 family transcriptional regulator, iron-sulfur cluster assembly transcription factor
MKVTAKIRYGLQLMVELALRHGRGPVLVPVIAERQGLPGKYLHVLLGSLKAAGLVRAQRGPSGGCELARHPGAISALEVLEALEGRPVPGEDPGDESVGSRVVAELWGKASQAEREVLDGTSLAQLAARYQSLEVDSYGYSI